MAQDLIDMLVDAGFERVSVVEKEESKEFIKDWLPGSGAEDYVVSANVTAYKPIVAGALADEDLYEDLDTKSSTALKAQLADAFASAAGVDARTAAPVGAALASLVAAVGGVVRALGAHHAGHTDAPGEVNCCADVDCAAEDLPTEVKKSC